MFSMTIVNYKTDLLKFLPIMLALCLMLSDAYYAKNYAGIIGLGLLINYETTYKDLLCVVARAQAIQPCKEASFLSKSFVLPWPNVWAGSPFL